MGFVPKPKSKGEIEMSLTDIRDKTEVWVALRRDAGDESIERAHKALNIIDALERHLVDIGEDDTQIKDALSSLRALRDTDTGYSRYHIQGIATTREIAVSMCRDSTYLIGPLPLNIAFPHVRTEWPGLHFPLKD